jgi:hypothetical protein
MRSAAGSSAPRDPRQLSWRWYLFMCVVIFVLPALAYGVQQFLYRLRDSAAYKLAHPARELAGHTGAVYSVAISPDS